MRKLMSALLVTTTVSALAVPAASSATASVSISAYGSSITVFGHGFGHGRGMGQYGAFGYATNFGWDYHQILDHYYAGSVSDNTTVSPTSQMKVRLVTDDGTDTILVNDSSKLTIVTPALAALLPGSYAAIRVQPVENADSTNTTHLYNLFTGQGCGGGPWVPLAGGPFAGPVQATVPGTDPATAAQPDLIGVCETVSPNNVRYYRGDIAAVRDANNAARTINIVPLDVYVRGVVPRESPASWGTATGPQGTGMAALQAQAVAARSYGWADNRYSFAKTCDTQACQVYGGAFLKANASATATALEDARSDSAVATTAGEVRMIGGNVVATEFSSSTGGRTAPGTFPSVVDDGDVVAANPNHNWTSTVPRSMIETAYPSIGTLLVIQIRSRNGIGDLGGRVNTLNLQGTAGSVTITGWDFTRAANADGHYRVLSDWFQVVSSALTSPAAAIGSGSLNTFYVATTDGGVLPFNGAQYQGSMLGTALAKPIVSMAVSSAGTGYWLLAGDGGVFSFNVPFYGSTGGMKLVAPVLALAARPQGDGYWFVASDGGVFAYNAPFEGSMGGKRLNKPVVGLAPTATGEGYWLVASDGGIFAFGDAPFFGSAAALPLVKPIIAMAARPQGDGYWLIASDGGIFTYGNAPFLGSAAGQLKTNAVAISATTTGLGYRVVGSDGTIVNFGDAT